MNFFRLAATVFLFTALLPGCGKKTDLVPPRQLVPVSINDLRYSLDQNGVTLRWSYPTEMVSGDPLPAVESFEVFRAGLPENEFCPECPVQFAAPVVLDGGALPGAAAARTGVYLDGSLKEGYRYLYKVRARAGWWYPSGDSNVVSFVWSLPPEIPRGLQLETGDKKIILRWEPVKENSAGKQLDREPVYQVYRKSGTAADFEAVGEPVSGTEFVDEEVVNGQHYTYRIRGLLASDGSLVAGGASREITGMPSDLEPPEQPLHLLAVRIPEGIRLVWQGAGAKDLAGYRIYRRAVDSEQAELLAEVGPARNQYIDRTAAPGRIWFYTVTSFDSARPANESAPSGEAAVDLR